MRKKKKYNRGGLLRGLSHAQGGMPAIIGGQEPVELEGGEYIIRKDSVDKYGAETIARINQGLVDPNKLRQLKQGGPIAVGSYNSNRRSEMARGRRRAPRRGIAPARRMARGGKTLSRGRNSKRMQMGGGVNQCPPGSSMQSGRCVPTRNMSRGPSASRSYNAGGRVGTRRVNRRLQAGGGLSRGRNLSKICKNRPANKKLLDAHGRDMCIGHR